MEQHKMNAIFGAVVMYSMIVGFGATILSLHTEMRFEEGEPDSLGVRQLKLDKEGNLIPVKWQRKTVYRTIGLAGLSIATIGGIIAVVGKLKE